ncbi:hypothetical protein [Ralstonia phage RP31]|uniref:Uncharacterized protein n=2 Tax=Ripduovirus RP12 TaxID=2560700 RepID=A0A1L7N120_9CAUD|nr:hypothetical protein FDH28_gp222 [Ralstonia phage RP12]BAW19173.1 hypothetical protein [Ralstonia phage RP12]BAW19459.1 hypothetical protein [Ralstonia phage RP31]
MKKLWDELRQWTRDNGPHVNVVIPAVMPKHPPIELLSPTFPGIYPVRELVVVRAKSRTEQVDKERFLINTDFKLLGVDDNG